MNEDRSRCIERIRRETTRGLGAGSPTSERNGTARPPTPLSSARRSIRVAASTANKLATSSLRFGSNSEPSSPTSPTSPGMPPAPSPVPAQDSTKVSEAVDRMVQTWDNEVLRMRRYLQRNYDLSQGSKVEAETQSSPPHVTWTAGQGSLERKSFIFMKPFEIDSEELEEETRQSTPISLIQFLREKQPSAQQALNDNDARRTHKLVSCAKQTRKLSPTTLGELWKQGHLGRKRSRNPSQRSRSTTALGIPGKDMEDGSSGGPTRRLSEKFSKLSRSLSLRRPKEMQPPRSTPQEQSEEPEVVEPDNVAHRRPSRKMSSCAKVSEDDGERDASGVQANDTTALTDDEDEDGDETLEFFDDECGGDTIYEALAYPADAAKPSKRRDSAVDFFTFLRGEEKHSLQGLHWRPPVATNRTYEHQQRQRAVWRPPVTFVM
ncbi:hypothetical protein KEM55_001328 [Ascosphaera atra]|nr:hypothetical protein KEM55_001328 [Ascosphaera atra]